MLCGVTVHSLAGCSMFKQQNRASSLSAPHVRCICDEHQTWQLALQLMPQHVSKRACSVSCWEYTQGCQSYRGLQHADGLPGSCCLALSSGRNHLVILVILHTLQHRLACLHQPCLNFQGVLVGANGPRVPATPKAAARSSCRSPAKTCVSRFSTKLNKNVSVRHMCRRMAK